MDMIEAVRYALEGAGVLGVAYALYRLFGPGILVNDAPIRVKGGSLQVSNSKFDWEEDPPDGIELDSAEYHSKGRGSRFKVSWGTVARPGNQAVEGSKVVLLMQDGTSADRYKVKIRANGGVRVFDQDGKLAVVAGQPSILKDPTSGIWVKKVTVRLRGAEVATHEYTRPTNAADVAQIDIFHY